jgi:hypothetical protein
MSTKNLFFFLPLLSAATDPMKTSNLKMRKVIDRFPGSHYPSTARCIFGVPDHSSPIIMSLGAFVSPQLVRVMKKMNCSFREFSNEDMEYGVMDSNGSYNKHLGMLQRHEIDVSDIIYRTDMFPHPVVSVLNQGPAADLVIVSRKNASNRIAYDLIPLWTSSFDQITAFYALMSCALFIIILSSIDCITIKPLTMRWQLLPKRLVRNVTKTLAALIDQQNFEETYAATRVAIFFFNLFILFAVHGVVFGSMGADLVAEVDPPIIQHVDEFTNTSFTQPLVFEKMIAGQLVKSAKPGGELWPVKQAIERDPVNNLYHFEWNTGLAERSAYTKVLMQDVNTTRKAIIAPDTLFQVLKSFGCDYYHDVTRNLLRSSNTFANGMYTLAISRRIDPVVRQVVSYYISTITETGNAINLIMETIKLAQLQYGLPSAQEQSCHPDAAVHGDDPIQAFGFKIMEPIFALLGYLLLASLVLLMFECNSLVWRVVKLIPRLLVMSVIVVCESLFSVARKIMKCSIKCSR